MFHRISRCGASLALTLTLIGISHAEVGFDCPERPGFRNLRYEENWRYLADPTCMDGRLDQLKYMVLDDAQQIYLSMGGELRLRYEFTNNPNFGRNPTDPDGYFLKRYLMHSDLHFTERARLFVQLQAANESGRLNGPRAEDEDDADINQAFVDVEMYGDGAENATLRAGRHELEFGASRLLSARDGLNTWQSFDGVRSFGRLGRWNYSATVAQPVNTVPGAFDNYSSPRNQYAGASVWSALPWVAGANLTVLSVYRRRQDARHGITTRRVAFSAASSRDCACAPGTSPAIPAIRRQSCRCIRDSASASMSPAAIATPMTVN